MIRDDRPAGIGGIPVSASEGTGRSPPTAGGGDCQPGFPLTSRKSGSGDMGETLPTAGVEFFSLASLKPGGRPGSLAGRLDVVKGRQTSAA